MKCYKHRYYSELLPKDYQEKFPEIEIPDLPVDPTLPTPSLIIRKNADQLSSEEQNRYINGIETLISSGVYSTLVGHHAGMHRMHGSMAGPIGYQRFLSWHRIYLAKLEEALRLIDPDTFIPYWKWSNQSGIPTWIENFTPSGVIDVSGNPLSVTRNPGSLSALPSEGNLATIRNASTYTQFTTALENGPHNFGHGWVGGRMNDIFYSPADPMFWLHHAEVDRQWHIWQINHPNQDPLVSGADAVLDPWPETTTNAKHITDLGYTYQETS